MHVACFFVFDLQVSLHICYFNLTKKIGLADVLYKKVVEVGNGM